ncbi:MAG: TIGR00269 family protein [Sulfolobales archaeon]
MLVADRKLKCSLCDKDAIVRIPYAKLRLCKEHFSHYIERRVKEAIVKYGLISKGQRVVIGVSGGKDSVSLLYILNKLSKEIGFELVVVHIDLGIGDYSKKSREIVKSLCESLGVPLIILDLKELIGYSLPEIVRRVKRPACSICGSIKRYLLNIIANELNADAVALGHNLDDLITFITKNFVLQNLFEISKLGPKSEGRDNLISRIRPLYLISEKEAYLYARINNLPFIEEICPFADVKSFEKTLRETINEIEEKHPGFKISLAKSIARNLQLYKSLGVEKPLKHCRVCGAPTSEDICSFCKLTEKITGRPLGGEVREKIREYIRSVRLVATV